MFDLNCDLRDHVKAALARRTRVSFQEPGWKASAVLLPLYYQDCDNYLVFTQRTELVRYHKREICFPGGGYHAGDRSLLDTALRESFEEIGLRPEDVEVLGELDDVPTRSSHYVITPFAGSIRPAYPFALSHFEAAELLEVPVRALLAGGSLSTVPPSDSVSPSDAPFVYTWRHHRITGATARIVKQFLDLLAAL